MPLDFNKLKKHEKYRKDFGKQSLTERVNQRANEMMNNTTNNVSNTPVVQKDEQKMRGNTGTGIRSTAKTNGTYMPLQVTETKKNKYMQDEYKKGWINSASQVLEEAYQDPKNQNKKPEEILKNPEYAKKIKSQDELIKEAQTKTEQYTSNVKNAEDILKKAYTDPKNKGKTPEQIFQEEKAKNPKKAQVTTNKKPTKEQIESTKRMENEGSSIFQKGAFVKADDSSVLTKGLKTVAGTVINIPARIVTGATKVMQDVGDFATYGIAQRSKSTR